MMGMLDGLLGQLGSNVDIANLAAKVGLTPEQVERAIAALGVAHTAPGDTVGDAATSTGLSADTLRQILTHLGGEGALGRLAGMLGQQGSGGLSGMLGGLFGKS